MKARITGTGSYTPSRIMTNAELERMVATSDEWIRERRTIASRYIDALEDVLGPRVADAGA